MHSLVYYFQQNKYLWCFQYLNYQEIYTIPYSIMAKLYPTIILVILMLCAMHVSSIASSPEGHHFLIEAKVLIDGKTYSPINISVTIGDNITIPEYSYNLSPVNFNKNVTLPLRLFVWYNGQWTLSRQTLSLKITDKRNILPFSSHLLANLLKYNSRKYESRMIDEKQSVILNFTSVIISYDPESSLFVSRLEDPAIFNKQNNYIPLASFSSEKQSKPLKITINFDVLTRSDAFINVKNHIVSLSQLASKIKQRIPLVSRYPQPQMIQPKLLWRLFLQNYYVLKKSSKQFNQKITLMANKKYQSLLSPRLHQVPSFLINLVKDQLSAFNISDNFVPTYYFALQQGFILDAINQLQDYSRQIVSDKLETDYLQIFQEWASKDIIASFVIAALWIILDIVSYKVSNSSQGLSYSFGYFFVAWLVFELFPLSIRIGQFFDVYKGFGFLFISLILIKFIVSSLQNKFDKTKHKYSLFDKKITQYVFNLIFLGVLANGILHLYVQQDIQNGTIILWSLGQFEMLLKQYYYFLVMIPPLLLSLALKSGQPIGWIRLILLLAIGLKDDYWLIIDHGHWTLIALRLKEEILFVLLFLVKVILGNRPIQVIKEEIQEKKVEQETKTTFLIKEVQEKKQAAQEKIDPVQEKKDVVNQHKQQGSKEQIKNQQKERVNQNKVQDKKVSRKNKQKNNPKEEGKKN